MVKKVEWASVDSTAAFDLQRSKTEKKASAGNKSDDASLSSAFWLGRPPARKKTDSQQRLGICGSLYVIRVA